MNPKTFREFERICSAYAIPGRVLEVGAVPRETSLLCLKSLASSEEKVGINLDGPYQYRDFKILKINANNMEVFEDNHFDVVLCNGVLEHDKLFWKTLSEIRRVTKAGGLIIIGAPGYMQLAADSSFLKKSVLFRAFKKFRWLNFIPALFRSTLTLEVHNSPGDYYRFSVQTFQDVFFSGLKNVEIRQINFPPNIIGSGTKPEVGTFMDL
jgi:SAM-dependent methyltransferase